MAHLVLKDFRAMKWYFLMVLANWILYSFAMTRFGLYINGSLIFTMILPVIFILVDTAHNTEILNCSLPVKRRTIVRARYSSSCIMILAGFLITLILGAGVENMMEIEMQIASDLLSIQGIALFILIAMSATAILLPFYYKYGLRTGFPVFLGFAAAVLIILSGIEYIISIIRGYEMFMMPIFSGIITFVAEFSSEIGTIPFRILSLVVIVSIVLLSMKLSEKYYDKRDL